MNVICVLLWWGSRRAWGSYLVCPRRPLSTPGRTRGALRPGEPVAPRAGAPAGWGAAPPPQLAYKSSWAGLSGPGPGGRQLSRACPSARRGRLSIREETFPYITIHCLIYGSRRCNSTCALPFPRYTNSKYRHWLIQNGFFILSPQRPRPQPRPIRPAEHV